MFDALLKDIGQRFGLGPGAAALSGMVLAFMFDERRGGFAGFLAALRRQGLGTQVGAWIAGEHGPVRSLSAAQVESVFGLPTLRAMAARLGTAQSSVAAAIGAMLPGTVAELRSLGVGPETVAPPSQLAPLLGEATAIATEPDPAPALPALPAHAGTGHRRLALWLLAGLALAACIGGWYMLAR